MALYIEKKLQHHSGGTGFSLNILFSLKCFFLNSAGPAAVLVFDLPLCTHTDTERGQSPEYSFKS